MIFAIVVLLVGFGIGVYWRGRQAEQAGRQAALKIAELQQKLRSLHEAEFQRKENTARSKQYFQENDLKDTNNQIKFIAQCTLRATAPVNKEASLVLYTLDEWVRSNQPTWRVSFEVGMGAFIKTPYEPENRISASAFSSYNSKRVDFLVVDNCGFPKLAVEYHGTGHDLSGDATDRMNVKRLALERARIPLIEIPANTSKAGILDMIYKTIGAHTVSVDTKIEPN